MSEPPSTGPTRRRTLGLLAAAVGGSLVAGRTARATATPESVPDSFVPVDRLPLAGVREAVVGPDGTTVFVAVTDGFAVVDASDIADPRVVAERRGLLPDRENGPLEGVWDLAVSGSRLLVVGPASGVGDQLQAALLYDVSEPTDPVRVSTLETDFSHHNAALDGTTAYLLGREDVRVVEMSGTPTERSRFGLTDVAPEWGEVRGDVLHDVTVRDGLAYAAYWEAGVVVADVSDPDSPSVIGRIGGLPAERFDGLAQDAFFEAFTTLPGNSHVAMPSPDGSLLAVGREAGGAEDEPTGGITIYDSADPAAPEPVTILAPPETRDEEWTTAHNFHFRGNRLYASFYGGGVRVYDLSTPADPGLVAAWRGQRAAFWTAVPVESGIVAADMGAHEEGYDLNVGAELYTFPEPEGGRVHPARTRERVPDPNQSTPTPSPTPSPTSSPTPSSPSPSPTHSETPPAGTGTASDGPGFGALAALGGLLGLGRWLAGAVARRDE